MSRHTPSALQITALLGLGLLIAGCNKKAENQPAAGSAAAGQAAAPAGGGTPGVTASEIKIGQSIPYSGPASAFGVLGKGEAAYFKMVNDKGGIKGRKLNLVSLDDGYNPAKAVENTRKLVESEGVPSCSSRAAPTAGPTRSTSRGRWDFSPATAARPGSMRAI